MTGYTTDPNDPELSHGLDDGPVPQAEKYLILSEEERSKGFVRPLRRAYLHVAGPNPCGSLTTMGLPLCETYAANPKFYSATYCCACHQHFPVNQFVWDEDGEVVGS